MAQKRATSISYLEIAPFVHRLKERFPKDYRRQQLLRRRAKRDVMKEKEKEEYRFDSDCKKKFRQQIVW